MFNLKFPENAFSWEPKNKDFTELLTGLLQNNSSVPYELMGVKRKRKTNQLANVIFLLI